jgi:hypothetical protein
MNTTVVGYAPRCANRIDDKPCGNILTIEDDGRCSDCRRNSVKGRADKKNAWRK